jgi:uncharacterized protein (DUF1800 family)
MSTNRREFLEALAQQEAEAHNPNAEDRVFQKYANKQLPTVFAKSSAGLNQYSGQWSEKQIIHLLRRSMFGVKPSDVQALSGMSMSQAVDYLLNNIPATPPPPVNDYNTTSYTDPTGVQTGQTWINAPYGDGNVNGKRRASLKVWWLEQMIHQNLSINEKMVFFWHNHFGVRYADVNDARMCYTYHQLLRSNALGNFKTLVTEVSFIPAMLKFLNGYLNTNTAPDENYAREIQELFTVGKFNNPNYTEADVQQAARVFTGWRINTSTLTSYFDPTKHDTGNKTFSGFYNNATINGQTGSNGANEAYQFIDMLFDKLETARYICGKLYRYFVYYNIDSNIESSIIEPLAQILVANNFEIKPVLAALLKSEHFYDVNSMGCFIRTPLDLVVGTARTFDLSLPTNFDLNKQFLAWNYLRNYAVGLNLDLGDPPNVAGWPAFYQTPQFYEIWLNAYTLGARMRFTDMMVNQGFTANTGSTMKIDVLGFTAQYNNAADPDALISYMASLILGIELGQIEHDSMKGYLLSGQTQNYYWSNAWNTYLANPNTANTTLVKTRLCAMLTAMMRLGEHQLA